MFAHAIDTPLPFTQARTRHAGHGSRDTADGTKRTHTHTSSRGHTRERKHVTIGQSRVRLISHALHARASRSLARPSCTQNHKCPTGYRVLLPAPEDSKRCPAVRGEARCYSRPKGLCAALLGKRAVPILQPLQEVAGLLSLLGMRAGHQKVEWCLRILAYEAESRLDGNKPLGADQENHP